MTQIGTPYSNNSVSAPHFEHVLIPDNLECANHEPFVGPGVAGPMRGRPLPLADDVRSKGWSK